MKLKQSRKRVIVKMILILIIYTMMMMKMVIQDAEKIVTDLFTQVGVILKKTISISLNMLKDATKASLVLIQRKIEKQEKPSNNCYYSKNKTN